MKGGWFPKQVGWLIGLNSQAPPGLVSSGFFCLKNRNNGVGLGESGCPDGNRFSWVCRPVVIELCVVWFGQ